MESGLATLGINWKIFLAQLFNVLVVFIVLRQWAFKPLVGLLEDRRKRVEKADSDAKEIDRRLAESAVEREATLVQARKDAQLVRETAVADSERLRLASTERTRAEVESMVRQGKQTLVREQEQMVRDARTDVAKLAVSAAEKILRAEVDHKRADALAAEAVASIT